MEIRAKEERKREAGGRRMSFMSICCSNIAEDIVRTLSRSAYCLNANTCLKKKSVIHKIPHEETDNITTGPHIMGASSLRLYFLIYSLPTNIERWQLRCLLTKLGSDL